MGSSNEASDTPFGLLCGIVSTEVVALLREMGVGATQAGACAPPQFAGGSVASIIGYAGETLRGSLAIVMSETAAALARAQTVAKSPGLEASRDFVGELSNQLLGRVKLRLLERDVVILLATPKTAAGGDLRVHGWFQDGSAWLGFDGSVGPMFVALDAVIDASLVIGDADPTRTPYHEGDMLLF